MDELEAFSLVRTAQRPLSKNAAIMVNNLIEIQLACPLRPQSQRLAHYVS
jgi:hypothetical protein